VSSHHLQLAHDDAQNRVQNLFWPHCGMDLAGDFEQRLQTSHLLLQVNHVGVILRKGRERHGQSGCIRCF
jgi:hypothetical protein